MTDARDKKQLDPDAHAARVLEDRNKAFRILYDTVMEVEGATDSEVYDILCRNLLRLCDARAVVLTEYDHPKNSLILKTVTFSGEDKPQTERSADEKTVVVSSEMRDRFHMKQVRACNRHAQCPLQDLAKEYLQDRLSSEETVAHCLSCIREGRLMAVAKVFLPTGHRLKMKDIVDTYMNMAGMILQRVQAVRAVQESEEKYRGVVERANDGILIIQDQRIVFANPQCKGIIGYGPEELIGFSFTEFVAPSELPFVVDRYVRRMAGEDVCSVYETQLKHKGGSSVHVELSVGVITYQNQRAELVIIRDITERKNAEDELRQKNERMKEMNAELIVLSRSDSLTRLANRRAWEEAVDREHGRFLRSGSIYSIVMIDIDSFKAYNDTQGHQAGDECLRKVAEKIAESCRTVDAVGRYGGEEFAILAPDTNLEAGIKLAERVRKAVYEMASPHPASPVADRVTISLGVAVCAAGSWEDVLKRADDALYVAKKAGRNMVYGGTGIFADSGVLRSELDIAFANGTSVQPQNLATHVLVVVNDPVARDTCTHCLGEVGYHVEQITDGENAVSKIRDTTPDVIVMDTLLPDGNGLELVRKIKATPDISEIPIILVGPAARSELVIAGLQAGADEYLARPIRGTELTLRVRSMARHSQSTKNLLKSYEVRGEHIRVLSCLVEFCRAIGASRNLDEVLEYTIAAAADLVHSQRVAIMLPDKGVENLMIRKSIGMDEELAETVRVPVGEAIAGQVFALARSIVVNRETDIPRDRKGYDAIFFSSVPFLSAPLRAADRIIGVLSITDRVGGAPFAQHELGYIELVTGVASTAIHEVSTREAHGRASESMMVALVRLAEYRDQDTDQHVNRVAKYCQVLAKELRKTETYRKEIDDAFLENLSRAAPLHDIGKVAIPDQILLHPGRLADEKMAVMRTHSAIGAQTIRSLMDRVPNVGFLSMAAEIAHHHHEWYDGSGYPDGLRGQAISLPARILAVADTYDALVTKRVYKQAVSHVEAISIVRKGAGTQFDPDLVEAFLRCHEQFKAIRDKSAESELAAVTSAES